MIFGQFASGARLSVKLHAGTKKSPLSVKPRPNGQTLFDKHLVIACRDLFVRLATMTNIAQHYLTNRICLSMFFEKIS